MKKIILLFILQLSMLMAAGLTITADKTLNRGTIPEADKPQAETIPGIIPNSIDLIYADMNEPNTGWVSNMKAVGQFTGPVYKDLTDSGKLYNKLNIWYEVEAAGNGKGCSPDINRATNTRVEVGSVRGFLLRNNVWKEFTSVKSTYAAGTGGVHPHPRSYTRGCKLSEQEVAPLWEHYPYNGMAKNISSSGFTAVKPKYYYRWHAWASKKDVSPINTLQAVYGIVYMRLIVDDPTKPDDRHLAKYVAHLSSDRRLDNPPPGVPPPGDIGMSRYKLITNDWQPINFYSFQSEPTKAELEANPPPIILEP